MKIPPIPSKKPLIPLFFSTFSPFVFCQQGAIKEFFSQTIIREDFNTQNAIFPTLTGIDGKYAIIIDSLIYYIYYHAPTSKETISHQHASVYS